MWRSNLYNRYITVYGKNIRLVEKHIHNYFRLYRITNELFDTNLLSDYINYTKFYLINK